MTTRWSANWSAKVRCALSASLTAVLVAANSAGAQVLNYPSFQTPRASVRDYTAAISSASGTTAIFQWREGVSNGMHLGLDAGLADPDYGNDLLLFFGGSLAKELVRSQNDQPLDVLFTAGAGLAFGGGNTFFRVPVGVSLGHTFELEGPMRITPYIHPRLSLDMCGDCGPRGGNDSEVSLAFDLGASWQINRQFALRASVAFSGSDYFDNDSFGLGFTWTPAALSAMRRR